MSKRYGIMDGVLKTIYSFLFDRLMRGMGKKIRSCIFDAVRPLVKKIILAIIGAALVIIGVLFICISLVKHISIYVPIWMAWGLIGLTILIIGSLMSIMALRKE